MKNNKLYYVKKQSSEDYSMFGFVMWSDKNHAKKYTLVEAEKLIAHIPHHVGLGVLVEVDNEMD